MTHPLMVATPMHISTGEQTVIPQKRKSCEKGETISTPYFSDEGEDELQEDEIHPVASTSSSSSGQAHPCGPIGEKNPAGHPALLEENEYEAGRVICGVCGQGVPIRDEETGGFSVAEWKEHRFACTAKTGQSDQDPEVPIPKPEPAFISPHQNAKPTLHKTRRKKRSEEERIDFFRTDPHVAQFEAYRVLCGNCNKWIRLRSNSSYCSIPWEAHRKSCITKKLTPGLAGTEQRKKVFTADPNIREFEQDRVLCNACEAWVDVETTDDSLAIAQWNQHRATCAKVGSGSPPPSELGRADSPSPALPPAPSSSSNLSSSTPQAELNEVRKRNAEQRAAALRQDPLISQVEPVRVMCSLCHRWIQLRKDTPYCAYPWSQHRLKCVLRHEKRVQQTNAPDDASAPPSAAPPSHSQTLRSRETDDDGDDASPKAKRAKLAHANSETDQDEDIGSAKDINLTDLESTPGRVAFVCQSVRYLFKTTYSRRDEMTIASLVTYLNSALPQDKYEDFDTVEVTRAAAAGSWLQDSQFVFEGDTLRFAN